MNDATTKATAGYFQEVCEATADALGRMGLKYDADTIAEIIEVAVGAGANLIDVLQTDPTVDGAYVWDGLGPFLREYRDRVVLVAHWGIGYRYDLPYCRKTFPEALAEVGNDYVDVAMMTMVGEPGRSGAWLDASLKELERYKRDGHVGCIGASMHDVGAATELVRRDAIDALMFAVNMTQYEDERQQVLHRVCADHGVGLIAMKPFSTNWPGMLPRPMATIAR